MNDVGIYNIECLKNHRMYFGSSVDLTRRVSVHKHRLFKGNHDNKHLQADWNLYGPDAFEFKVLIRHNLSKFKLLELENLFIHNYWDEQTQCYNIARDAKAPTRGRKSSEETRAKLRGRKHTVEERERQSNAQTGTIRARGRKLSAEHRSKIAIANRNRAPISDETRAKMSQASTGRNVGRKHSPETKAKISATKQANRVRVKISPLSEILNEPEILSTSH